MEDINFIKTLDEGSALLSSTGKRCNPSSNFDIPTIDMKVLEHYQVGDGATFDKHYFVIKVRVENLTFNVDRSYVDFVDLDRRLRKKFPRTEIAVLPLDQSSAVEKMYLDRRRSAGIPSTSFPSTSAGGTSNSSMLGSQTSTNRESFSFRDSIIQPSFSSSKVLKVKDYNEEIFSKVDAIDSYMVSLLSLHEVVVSDEILLFLDEEASSMAVDPDSLLPLTVHDLLLSHEPTNKRNVSRIQEHTFQVRSGQFVIWKFNTLKYDIGFSVELNGESKIAFTRYKSYESSICGAFEANQNAICKLKWDNSYAKLRTKKLTWTAKVVNPEDYYAAKTQALDVQREKKKFEDQRHALKRSALRHASLLSGMVLQTFSSDVVSEQAQEEKKKLSDLEDEVSRLKLELLDYQADIENAQVELEEMEQAKTQAEEAREQMQGSWMFTLEQLEKLQGEHKTMKSNYNDSQLKHQDLEQLNSLVTSSLKKSQEQIKEYQDRELELTDACQAALEQSDAEIMEIKKSASAEVLKLQEHLKMTIESNKKELDLHIRRFDALKSDSDAKLADLVTTQDSLIDKNCELLEKLEKQNTVFQDLFEKKSKELQLSFSASLEDARDKHIIDCESVKKEANTRISELLSRLEDARFNNETSTARFEAIISEITLRAESFEKELLKANQEKEQQLLHQQVDAASKAEITSQEQLQRTNEFDVKLAQALLRLQTSLEENRCLQNSIRDLQEQRILDVALIQSLNDKIEQLQADIAKKSRSFEQDDSLLASSPSPSFSIVKSGEFKASLKNHNDLSLKETEGVQIGLTIRVEELESEIQLLVDELAEKSAMLRRFSSSINDGDIIPFRCYSSVSFENSSKSNGDHLLELQNENSLLQGQLHAEKLEQEQIQQQLEEKNMYVDMLTKELVLIKKQLAGAKAIMSDLSRPMETMISFLEINRDK